ncbi:DUF6612 family protein [Gemella sanguinis]|uniref:DUF6612 family protein n=1 Tax=Gemella sanguinis TaxID=84135 RepID=UPI0008076CAE|nr:DUF6612 family protein [Gemella sanguinis]
MNKLFKKNLLIISITILIAASAIFIYYKKVQHQSQTESQSSSQTNPITSQYVIEKYSETVKNVKSFKYKSEYSTTFYNIDRIADTRIEDKTLATKKIQDGTLSIEPFSLQTNISWTDSTKSQNSSNYVNGNNILYYKKDNQSWKRKESSQSISEAIDSNKKYIDNDKFLDTLKNVADDLILEEQGDNYILTFIGTDDKFISLLSEFDSDLPPALSDLKKYDGKYLNFRLTINKSTFEPIEISLKANIYRHSLEGTGKETERKIEAKRTFSEINTAKVEFPEDIQFESQDNPITSTQAKPITSNYVIEKYSERVKNVKSFKYKTEHSTKSINTDPKVVERIGAVSSVTKTIQDGTLSIEPFSSQTNIFWTGTTKSQRLSNYINESNILYYKIENEPWKSKESRQSISERIDTNKQYIANDKFLDALKNVADDLILEDQGDKYNLTYTGNDDKFISLLSEFDSSLPIVLSKLEDTDLKNLDLRLTINKSTFDPIEISFIATISKKRQDGIDRKIEAIRTFSEINTAKVIPPEGIQ